MEKSSKSHLTDSDVDVRTPESGVGRLRGFASKPSPPLSLSALRPLFRHRNQAEPSRESPCGVKNKAHVAETYLSLSYPLPPTAAPPIRTLTENDVRRLLVLLAPKVHEKTFSFSLLFGGEKQQKTSRSPFAASGKTLFSLLFGGEKQQKPPDRFRCRRPKG